MIFHGDQTTSHLAGEIHSIKVTVTDLDGSKLTLSQIVAFEALQTNDEEESAGKGKLAPEENDTIGEADADVHA